MASKAVGWTQPLPLLLLLCLATATAAIKVPDGHRKTAVKFEACTKEGIPPKVLETLSRGDIADYEDLEVPERTWGGLCLKLLKECSKTVTTAGTKNFKKACSEIMMHPPIDECDERNSPCMLVKASECRKHKGQLNAYPSMKLGKVAKKMRRGKWNKLCKRRVRQQEKQQRRLFLGSGGVRVRESRSGGHSVVCQHPIQKARQRTTVWMCIPTLVCALRHGWKEGQEACHAVGDKLCNSGGKHCVNPLHLEWKSKMGNGEDTREANKRKREKLESARAKKKELRGARRC